MINIAERPAEADDRVVPGHWEGDLIIGKKNLTAIGTLVERTTGFTMLMHLPDGYKPEQVRDALAAKIQTLPQQLPKRPGAPDPRNVDPRISSTSRGNYKLGKDIIFATDAPIFVLGRKSPQHCFHGVLPDGSYPGLDNRPPGAGVRFVAQPLDVSAGADTLGREFVAMPRITLTDIHFRRAAARQALRRLGCLTSALQEYGE